MCVPGKFRLVATSYLFGESEASAWMISPHYSPKTHDTPDYNNCIYVKQIS